MSITVLTVDGNDLATDLGLIIDSRISGWRDMMGVQRKFTRVPDKIAQQQLTVQVQPAPRRLIVRGILEATTVAALNTNRDTLKYRLNLGELTVTFDDEPTRYYKAYPDGPNPIQVTGIHPALTQLAEEVAISLVCYDPRQYEISATSVGPFTADTAHALGTAPVGASFAVSGTTFTLTYKDSGGLTVQTFTITSATGTSPLTVDMENQTVLDNFGVKQDQFLTGGDFFLLDPNDGDYEASSWPTVACASSVTSTYNKAYL